MPRFKPIPGEAAGRVGKMDDFADVPRPRVILLGASNLVRGIADAVETARRVLGQPIELLIAMGHGRSYGMSSTILGRTLPGIIACGLWRALDELPPAPTYGLLTDVGNDILYGADPVEISAWIGQCLDRLAVVDCRAIVTELPLESAVRLPSWQYRILRTLLYPSSRLSLAAALERSGDLNERVIRVAAARGAPLVRPRRAWYGVDSIHIRRRHRRAAWQEFMGAWANIADEEPRFRVSVGRSFYLRRLAPEYRLLWGSEKRCTQPSGRLPDGTTIALY